MITRTMGWTRVDTDATFITALANAKGVYQRNIIRGYESLSGSTLKGKAMLYRSKYKASSNHLLYRLIVAGLRVEIMTGPKGARLLVIKAAPVTFRSIG